MDSNFGEYITEEYGLLRQILSYLKPKDLHNARYVCRKWRKAVDNLVEKMPIIISYKLGQKNSMVRPSKPFLPHLVIYQNVTSKHLPKPEICGNCNINMRQQCIHVCYCDVIGPETAVLFLNNLVAKTPYNPELYMFWQLPSVLAFSSPENIVVSSYNCSRGEVITNNSTYCSLTQTDDIKGVFVISKSCHQKTVEHILNASLDKHGPTLAVGGGIADKFSYNESNPAKGLLRQTGVYVIFKGENVTVHSEIVSGRDPISIESSMEALRQRTGEVPEGGSRIAFIAQCVDRRDEELEKLESGLFRKYFPGVPQCGFPAWGEYGVPKGSLDDQQSRNNNKRRKISFLHSFTTSILIFTLRK